MKLTKVSGPPSPGKPVLRLMISTMAIGTPTSRARSAINPPAKTVVPGCVTSIIRPNTPSPDTAFMSLPPHSRSMGLFFETEELAVLPGEPVHHLGLVLVHVQDLLALGVLVSGRPRNKSRGLTIVLFPDLLRLRSCEEGSKKMARVGMVCPLKHGGIVSR